MQVQRFAAAMVTLTTASGLEPRLPQGMGVHAPAGASPDLRGRIGHLSIWPRPENWSHTRAGASVCINQDGNALMESRLELDHREGSTGAHLPSTSRSWTGATTSPSRSSGRMR
jgi:hypothetical protein